MSSSSLNDGKAAIPLLKEIQEMLSPLIIRSGLMDADYDFVPIYQQLLSLRNHYLS
ncbi:hypothetical protein [Peribacillus simplex]|uniref:hypothetical protein n=1 Tax=Peribacillus simplex TaxID=1478 RepID=UPI003CFFCFB4